MPRINLRRTVVGALALLVVWLVAAPATASIGPSSIVHLQTTHDGRTLEGSGVVVGVEPRDGSIFVMTAAPLFTRADGEPAAEPVRVSIGGWSTTIGPDRILRPVGDIGGAALLRVDTRDGAPFPAADVVPIDYHEPALGGVFVVAVAGPAGHRVDVAERVRFGATRLVMGDRGIAHLPACLGGAALTTNGVFGVVVDCASGRAPVVALATTIRRFLGRHLPEAPALGRASSQPSFRLSDQVLTGPLVSVGCDAVASGEVEVPFALTPNQQPVGATASLLDASSIRLGDVAILDLDDRRVKVRFTLVGVPPPHYSLPENCARGQALVSVRLQVVTVAR